MKIAGYAFIGLLIVSAAAQAVKLLVIALIGLIIVAFVMHPREVLNAMIFAGVLALIREYPGYALALAALVVAGNWVLGVWSHHLMAYYP